MKRSTKIGLGLCLILGGMTFRAEAQAPPDFDAMTQGAIQKSIPLIQKGATGFSTKTQCVSCHNQSLPQMTLAVARKRGFLVDEKQAQAQDAVVYKTFLTAKPVLIAAQKSKEAEKQLDTITVDPAPTMTYMMAGMIASKQKPDEITGLMAHYLAKKQETSGRWPVNTARPPMEASEFATTALGVYALKNYGMADTETPSRISKAKVWLLASRPHNTEDKAFRLFGLHWAGAEKAAIEKAVEDLLDDQHDEGGWGQLPNLPSDAYATGEVLVALHEAGEMPVTHSAYQRGRFFLLTTQAPDGSWFVAKRATTVQTYVDAGYPYENAQYISMAGACWATMALLYTAQGTVPVTPVKAVAVATPHRMIVKRAGK